MLNVVVTINLTIRYSLDLIMSDIIMLVKLFMFVAVIKII